MKGAWVICYRGLRRIAGLAAVSCAVLAGPAQAAERFASSAGVNVGNCQNTAGNPPCNITRAILSASTGDTVTVLADGTHVPTSELNPAGDNLTIRGAPGQPRPTISSAQNSMMSLDPGSEIRDLILRHTTGAGITLRVDTGALVERVLVDSVGANACQVTNNAVIRDSVCWMRSASPARHALIATSTTGEPADVTLRNVTAVRTAGTGAGVRLVSGSGVDAALDGRNVIAQGSVDSDVSVQGSGGGGDASATFANSNYDTAVPNAAGGTATTTPPTDPAIQTAPPAFVNAGSGDFHEAAGSPTINSGSAAVSLLGATDVDGAPRIQGPAPDIGAYEFDQIAPSVVIDSGPGEGETLGTSTASFTFSSDDPTAGFTCELDGGGFGPCTGPGAAHTASGLGNGAHTFSVRATDMNGNASVATRSFSVSVGGGPDPDTDPPETTITKHPMNRTESEKAKFKFRSDEPGSTFRCKRDKKPFKPCTSPRKYRNLDEGKHKFKVAAVDPAGNVDRTPDKDTWKIVD